LGLERAGAVLKEIEGVLLRKFNWLARDGRETIVTMWTPAFKNKKGLRKPRPASS
jgi:hypothetical protein